MNQSSFFLHPKRHTRNTLVITKAEKPSFDNTDWHSQVSYLCMFKPQYNPVKQMLLKIRELCREELKNWPKAKVIDADSQT